MSLQSTTLQLLLRSDNQEQNLQGFERLSSNYFSGLFSSVYRSISHFYELKTRIPSIAELKLHNARNPHIIPQILQLEKLELPDVPLDLQVEQLESEYVQQVTIEKLTKFADNLPMMQPQEIAEQLSGIQMVIEDEMVTSDKVFYGNEVSMFNEDSETQAQFSTLGLQEEWDNEFLGGKEEELILIGGHRGAGKSIICANICQHILQKGNIQPYCTIEMSQEETYQRIWQCISGVRFSSIRNGTMNHFELCQLQMSQSAQYEGGFQQFMDDLKNEQEVPTRATYKQLEEKRKKSLNQILPIIVIDDRNLKISTIDLTLTSQKQRYGDLLTTVIVDYVNQLTIEGVKSLEKLDWKVQTQLATLLKNNIARKHKVLVVSPYQIDENGATRLQKGLLDAVDMQFLISKDSNVVTLTAAKLRNLPAGLQFNTYMSWEHMKLLPQYSIKKVEEGQ